MARYRAALEAGTDPETAAAWIREVQADRALAAAQLNERQETSPWLGDAEIAAHLDAFGDARKLNLCGRGNGLTLLNARYPALPGSPMRRPK